MARARSRPPRKRRSKQTDQLVLALACGGTVAAAARQAGVSPRTVYRRLADPEFQRAIAAHRGEMFQRSSAMLTAASLEAVRVLLHIAQSAKSESARVSAARAILWDGIRYRE